jgi:flavin-dependent dehydrogenase
MRSDVIKRRGVNLRQALLDVVERHPYFRERFRHAERLGDIKGYGLPLGSKTRKISGDGYILLGDAASLIDPLTGEGIGNAFYSGFIAAEQARDCLAANNFSAAFLQAYDRRVRRVLGSEMQLSYRLQKAGAYAPLLNMIANLISGNQNIMNYLSGIYTDFSLREQLVKPLFWLKLLGRK